MATPIFHRIFYPNLRTPIDSTNIARSLNRSLIHQDPAPPPIDPSFQARSLQALRGTPSAPSMASHVLTGGSGRSIRSLLPSNDQKLSPPDDSGPPDDKAEELGLVGPFRDQSLDRLGRLKELKELVGIFKPGVRSFEERIEAIEELTNLTTGDDAEQNVRALMEIVKNPEAGLSFTVLEALNEEWRLHNHVKISLIWMHGLSAILRLLKRGEIEDRKTMLKQVIRISLNHPWDVTLVHLEEDWPADDPHRVAPYLIDPDRAQRLLLGELINELTRDWDTTRAAIQIMNCIIGSATPDRSYRQTKSPSENISQNTIRGRTSPPALHGFATFLFLLPGKITAASVSPPFFSSIATSTEDFRGGRRSFSAITRSLTEHLRPRRGWSRQRKNRVQAEFLDHWAGVLMDSLSNSEEEKATDLIDHKKKIEEYSFPTRKTEPLAGS